jgi:hypothetical protein
MDNIRNLEGKIESRQAAYKVKSEFDADVSRRKADITQRESSSEYQNKQNELDQTFIYNPNTVTSIDVNKNPLYYDKDSELLKNKREQVKQTARSMNERNSPKSFNSAINEKKNKGPEDYMYNRLDKERNKARTQYDALSGEEKKQWRADRNIEDDSDSGAYSYIKNKYNESIKNGPNMVDKMWGYKIPQKTLGVGTTAFLVSSMFSKRGQQSNAELYGQQTPYQQ